MDLEAELLKGMQKAELEDAIEAKISSFHGLLTKEAAVRLIARDKGLLKREDKMSMLGRIPKGERNVCLRARVRKIWPEAIYASGKRSRVVELEDATGWMPLVLWNDDVGLAAKLRSRDSVGVWGAYERNGELHLGYSGRLEVLERAGFSDLASLEEGGIVHLRGVVAKIEGADSFVKGSQTVKGFSFILSDGKAERRCVLLEDLARAGKLEQGDDAIIENGLVGNGNVEIGPGSRLLSRRTKDMLVGELSRLECDGERLLATVGGKDVVLERAGALHLLGVRAAGDISVSTVAELKRDALINTRMALRLGQQEGPR